MMTKGRTWAMALAAAGVASATASPEPGATEDEWATALAATDSIPIQFAPVNTGPNWVLTIDSGHQAIDLTETYYSGPSFNGVGTATAPPGNGPVGMELWRANYDEPDGWLYGFTAGVAPSFLCGGVVDFSYRTGDLDGRFSTTPLAGGPVFDGDVDIDRDQFELGLTYPLWQWFYGRVAYFNRDDDVVWDYGDNEIERQEYEMQGVEAGVGMKSTTPIGDTGLDMTLDAFLGLIYFDLEHKEVAGGLTTDWDGFGYVLRGGAGLAYALSNEVSAVGGVSYEFMKTDDSGLDLENFELLLSLGVAGNF